MSLVEFEIVPDAVTICDTVEDSYVTLTMAQWKTLIEYFEKHPLDKHGWMNHINDDGSLTGVHACPCHNIA